jgi:RNase adaptor protein for sRNA GlmZ degradation
MRHFALLLSNNTPKNALQRQALDFLREQSHQIIENNEIFFAHLRTQIERINAEHPRCSALNVSAYGMGSIGVTLGAHFTVNFRLYPIKEAA